MKKWIISCLMALTLAPAVAQTSLTQSEDFNVSDVYLFPHHLNTYLAEGKHVLLYFFFTDCQPCLADLPALRSTHFLYGSNNADVVFIGIENGHTDPEVLQFAQQYSLNFPVISGDDGGGNQVTSDYDIGAHPTAILIAPDKQVVYQDIYPITEWNIVSQLTQAGLNPIYPVSSPEIIEETRDEASVSVYPNPITQPTITLEYFNVPGPARIEIINIIGEVVQTVNNVPATDQHRGEITFTADQLANGTYFVRLMSNEVQQALTKLVVAR